MKKLLKKFIILAIISMLIGHNATKDNSKNISDIEQVGITKEITQITEYIYNNSGVYRKSRRLFSLKLK